MQQDWPFDTLETTFQLLVQRPRPLAVDGRSLGTPLPARLIPLDELRTLLLGNATPYQARDAAVGALLRRAQAERGAALVGLAGVLLPGLRRLTGPLVRSFPDHAADIQAAVLTGLLEAVATFPTGSERPASRLVWAAARAGHRFAAGERAWRANRADGDLPPARPASPGHPDMVLAKAVAAGALSQRDADLVGETRIGEVRLHTLADRWQVGYKALCKRRERAERALVGWLDGQGATPARTRARTSPASRAYHRR